MAAHVTGTYLFSAGFSAIMLPSTAVITNGVGAAFNDANDADGAGATYKPATSGGAFSVPASYGASDYICAYNGTVEEFTLFHGYHELSYDDVGFIVADNGSAGYISGAPAAGWDDDDLHTLQSVPGSALEVVDTSKLPGTPKRAVLWNARWTTVAKLKVRRLTSFHSRSGAITLRAIKNGKLVARRTLVAKQGYVQIDAPNVVGARYFVTAA